MMLIKQKFSQIKNKFSQLPLPFRILIGVDVFLMLFLGVGFFIDEPVQFSYTGESCVRSLTFLPSLSQQTTTSGFTVTNKQILAVGGLQLASLQTCFTAEKAPQTGVTKVSVAPLGGWFARATFALTVPKPPVANVAILADPVPTGRSLLIPLSNVDTTFDYLVEANDKVATCPQKGTAISCDIPALGLAQGKDYELQLVRFFHSQKIATVAQQSIKTLVATSVVTSSVTNGQIIYDTPKSFTVTFDKPIAKADVLLNKITGTTHTLVAATSVISGSAAILNLASDLDRNSSYELTVKNLIASDGSTLVQDYVVDFSASDGPKVASVSVGTISVPQTQTIALTFDQALLGSQDATKLVSVKGISTTVTKTINQILLNFTNAPLCTDFTINIAAGLQSKYGVVQDTAWSFNSRTICHTVSTIGHSVEGRAILAYTFCSGSKTILYTGSIHGNELSANALMLAWINELEVNARSIPAGTQIVVVPAVNPDGVAANRRNNSHNVDLNRNFDTDDWQSDIVSPTNQPIPAGGGATPMSEPETQTIAAFTTALMPRLTMSFHSQAGYAIANQGGDSDALATTYSQMTGYQDMTGNGGAFDYSITGTYDDWIREKLGLASVLVELSSNTNSEFSRNKAALWAMARS
jgi:predicted deacylase